MRRREREFVEENANDVKLRHESQGMDRERNAFVFSTSLHLRGSGDQIRPLLALNGSINQTIGH